MKIRLNEKDYDLKSDFYSLTITDAKNITDIDISKEKLDLLIDDVDNLDDDMRNYIIEIIYILSNAPKDILSKLSNMEIYVLYLEIKHLLLYIYRYNFEDHKSLGVDEIPFKDKVYKIPPYLKVGDDLILFYKEASKNVLEVSNLMKIMEEMEHKGVGLLNYICAIYLKENVDEIYDDEKVNERADIFKDLPLYVAYEVFFCIYYYICYWAIASKIYSARKKKRIKHYIQKIKSLIVGFFKRLKVGWSMMWKKQKRSASGNYVR